MQFTMKQQHMVLKENNYAGDPRISTFDRSRCYPDLKSIPEKPDAVFMLTSSSVTEQIVQQCVELDIKHVWMHCMMGTKPGLVAGSISVSSSAMKVCRKRGIAVILGSRPAQFLNADFGHAMMHKLWGWFGYLNVDGGTL